VAQGFSGRVFCTAGTADLTRLVLPDSGRIQEEDARQANKHGYTKHHPALPLYDEAAANRALTQLHPVSFRRPIEIAAGITIEFVSSTKTSKEPLIQRVRGKAMQQPWRIAEERFRVDELVESLADDRLLIGKPSVADDPVDLASQFVRDVGCDFRHRRYFTVLSTLNFINSANVMVESRSSRASLSA